MAPPPSAAAHPSTRAVAFRGGGFQPRRIALLAPVFFAGLIVLWWAATTFRWVSPIALPPPADVARTLTDMIVSGELARHVGASLGRLVGGWTLGAAVGVATGLAIGLSSVARSTALPLVSALFPIPKIALLPLFVIWFGIGEASKVATIAFGVFAPMAIAAFGGVDQVDRNLIRMAQSFGLPTRDIVWKIVLPGALPGLLSGVRISASIAIILLTAAEMLGAEYGIGALVLAAGNLMQADRLIAGVLVLSGLGLVVAAAVGGIEKRWLAWR